MELFMAKFEGERFKAGKIKFPHFTNFLYHWVQLFLALGDGEGGLKLLL